MKFHPGLVADAVHHQMIVQVIRVHMSGYYHFKVRELLLGKLQSDGVGLLWSQVILLREGLDEVVILPPVCFVEPLLRHLHLQVCGSDGAVISCH